MASRFHIDQRYVESLAALGLRDLASLMKTRVGTLVGAHADRDVMRLSVTVDGQARELYLKRTFKQVAGNTLADLLRGHWLRARPVREYQSARTLARLGIPAARAVGYGERRRWLLPIEGFLLVEAVPARFSLYDAWQFRNLGDLARAGQAARLTIADRYRFLRAYLEVLDPQADRRAAARVLQTCRSASRAVLHPVIDRPEDGPARSC